MESLYSAPLLALASLIVLLLIPTATIKISDWIRKTRPYLWCEELFFYFMTTGFSPPHFELPGQATLHEKRGSTFIRNFFGNAVVFTADMQNVKTVWSTNFEDWGLEEIRIPTMGQLTGRSLNVLDGEPWKQRMQIVKRNMGKSFAPVDIPHMEKCFIGAMERIANQHGPLELTTVISDMYFECAYRHYVGKCIDNDLLKTLGVETPGEIRVRVEDGAIASLLGPVLNGLRYLTGVSPGKKASFQFANMFADVLADRVLQGAEEDIGSSSLIKAFAWSRDRQEIKNETLDYFITAPGSISNMLSLMLFRLGGKPTVWARLRREVLAIGDEPLTEETLEKIKYLQLIVNETIRLYPITCFGSRVAKRDTYLPVGDGGKEQTTFISAGTRLSANFVAMHRDPLAFGSDPNEFRPERWNEIKRPAIWQYMPFSRGPRACLGKYKATTELKYLVSRFAQEYKEIRPAKSSECSLVDRGRPVMCPVTMVKA